MYNESKHTEIGGNSGRQGTSKKRKKEGRFLGTVPWPDRVRTILSLS